MDQQVREEIYRLITQGFDGRIACLKCRGVTEGTPGTGKEALAASNRLRATGCGGRRYWRCQEAHEEGELLDCTDRVQDRLGVGVGNIVRSRGELARRVFIALRLKQFVGDAHFDVVGFSGK